MGIVETNIAGVAWWRGSRACVQVDWRIINEMTGETIVAG